MDGTNDSFRPKEGISSNSMGSLTFSNSFSQNREKITPQSPNERERTKSRDYSVTDEWDASKVPPSRFQQRKGSIYATPPSRDGHVQRNYDNTAEFHKTHSKRFSLSKAKDKVGGAIDGHRRKSSAGSRTSSEKNRQNNNLGEQKGPAA